MSQAKVREGGRKLPGWAALMQGMIDELNDRGCDELILRKLRKMLVAKDYLSIAEQFKKSTSPDDFARFLRGQLAPPDLVRSEIHSLLLAIEFRGIITTNFDAVIEFHSDRFRKMVFPQFLDEPGALVPEQFLAKIHGCISSTPDPHKHLVLTRSAYKKLRENQRYQMLVSSWFLNYVILTVGFSLTDPDFLGVVDDRKRLFGSAAPTIYALMRKPTEADCRRWRKDNIEIIPYRKHRDLKLFFSTLLELSEKLYPSDQLITKPIETSKVAQVKAKAWEFYSSWRKDGSFSQRLGKVNITLKGWRHVTRISRPQEEVCHKLTLLPLAKELIEHATESVLLRSFEPIHHKSGRTIEKQLRLLKGRYVSPFRAEMRIRVILEVSKVSFNQIVETTTSFFGVHETRD